MHPRSRFACDILRIRLTTSRSRPGRPRRPDRLFHLQKRLKPSRCHRITVAGSTIARASLQPAHPWERIIQKARSHTLRRRRRPPRVRMSTASCCRSARFSRASSRRLWNSDLIVPKTVQRRVDTPPTVPADHAAAQGVPAGWTIRQPQATVSRAPACSSSGGCPNSRRTARGVARPGTTGSSGRCWRTSIRGMAPGTS